MGSGGIYREKGRDLGIMSKYIETCVYKLKGFFRGDCEYFFFYYHEESKNLVQIHSESF